MDNGGYYVTTRKTFSTLQELVSYYTEGSNGLCHELTRSCPKSKPSYWPSKKDEIERKDLEFVRELGGGNFGKVYYGKFRGLSYYFILNVLTINWFCLSERRSHGSGH